VAVVERKSKDEIKERILEALNDKPLNALEISKAIGSNWSTVKTYVEELTSEKKIKEISFRNQTFYQKIIEDTYFNIPIKEEERDLFKFIFCNALEKYRELTGKPIRRTELAKLSAEINNTLKLNLPIVWYIYGPMPIMIIDTQKDYTPKFIPKNADEIKKAIEKWIRDNKRDFIRELKVEYYQRSNNTIYVLKEKIYRALEKEEYDSIPDLSFELLSAVICYSKKFGEIMEEFYGIASSASYIKLFDNPRFQNKFTLAFDSLWKYLAMNMLIDSLNTLGYSKEETAILLGPTVETKNYFAIESISELKEFLLENLPEKISPPKLTTIPPEARKVIDQWMDSEVWRD
jgi:hypothetical protein